jgi:aquaporin Z
MSTKLRAAVVAELVGTFALVFIGAGAVALGAGGLVGIAFAHGLVVAAFAYAFGHISGAHVNPAVTLGVWVARKIDGFQALAHVGSQLVGGILGALVLCWVLGGRESGLGLTALPGGGAEGEVAMRITPAVGVVVEAILTFFLVTVVLNTAVAGRGGDLAGLAIGLTLVFCILMGGPLTGASLNPARSIGPAVVAWNFTRLWVYIVGPCLGAWAAAGLYRGVLSSADATT